MRAQGERNGQRLGLSVAWILLLHLALLSGGARGVEIPQTPNVAPPPDVSLGTLFARYDASGRVLVGRPGTGEALALELVSGRPFRGEWLEAISREVTPKEERWTLKSRTDGARYRGVVRFDREFPGLIHWSVWGAFDKITPLVESAPDVYTFDLEEKKPVARAWRIDFTPRGLELPAIQSRDPALGAEFLYFVNLSALDPLYARTAEDPFDVLFARSGGMGYRRPSARLPAGVEVPLADAFLYVRPSDGRDSELDAARAFLGMMADIYDRLEKPSTVHTDWAGTVAKRAARDLLRPENWVGYGHGKYLRPYAADARPSIEYIAGGDVLVPLRNALDVLEGTAGDVSIYRTLAERIEAGIPIFYDLAFDGMGSIGNNPAPMGAEWDAWYWFNGYLNTLNLARQGSETARRMALGSAEKLIEVGRAFGYRFPFVLDIARLRTVRADFMQGDTTGAYIYLMLSYYQLTQDPVYLQEAEQAAERIADFGFDLSYEMHMTGVTAAALAWLAEVTGDTRYVELAYVPLANVLRATWLWENDYGWAREYATFGGLSPISGSEMITAFEMHNTWRYLVEFYRRAHVRLPASVRKLVAELIKHQMNVGRYTLPPYLPEGALSHQPDLGRVDPYGYIPLEDLRSGRFRSGTIGQEIYGAGLPFQFVAGAYRRIEEAGVRVFSEYPITDVRYDPQTKMIRVRMGGTPEYSARVRLEKDTGRGELGAWMLVTESGYRPPVRIEGDALEAMVPGGSTIILKEERPAWAVFGDLGPSDARLVAAGGGFDLTLKLSNPTGVAAAFSVKVPEGSSWSVSPGAWTLAARSSETVRFHIAVSEHAKPGLMQVRVGAEVRLGWGEQGADGSPDASAQGESDEDFIALEDMVFLVEVVDGVDEGFSDTFNGPVRWTSYLDTSLAVESGFGQGIFKSHGSYGMAISPELVVDIDRYPILSIKVREAEGRWALKVVSPDGPKWGWYIQGDTRQRGVFRYDLRERLGWRGLRRFHIMLVPVGSGKRLVVDWVRVGPKP